MPSVTNRSQLVNPLLTNVARNYQPEGFIYDQLIPTIPVSAEAFEYAVWESWHNFATDVETKTPDRGETREVDLEVSKEAAVAEDHALKISVSEREKNNSQVNIRQAKVRTLQNRLLLAREVRAANLLDTQDATPAGGLDNSMDATPSNNWNVDAGAIESDIITAKEAVYDAIGIEPNTIVVPYKVANAISTQQDIREIFKYTVDGRQLLGAGANILPPEIWGLRVLVPRGRRVTNAQGQTNTFADVWGDDVRVLYVNRGADIESPSVAYRFQARGPKVTTWYENDPDGVEWVRNSEGILIEKVVAPHAGYVIKDVLS